MSSGAECNFTERKPGEWMYEIQQWPYGEWPEYDKHGPFATLIAAQEHLDANYQNPGGYGIDRHSDHVHNGKQIDAYWDAEKQWTCCGDEVEVVA